MNLMIIPEIIIKDKEMRSSDWLVFGVLVTTAITDKTNIIEISYSQINKKLPNFNINTIKQSIVRLAKRDYILIIKGTKKTQINKYQILQGVAKKFSEPIKPVEKIDMEEIQYLIDLIQLAYKCEVRPAGAKHLFYLATKFGLEELHIAVNICIDKYEAEELFEKIGGVLYNRRKNKYFE